MTPVALKQRYLYNVSSSEFIGEVIRLKGGTNVDIKVVQDINYHIDVGHVFINKDVASSYWTLLNGQEAP